VQETIAVDASGGTELLYQFHIYDYDSKVWGMIQDYKTNPIIKWTFNATGRYQIMCFVKDKTSDNQYDKVAYCEVTVNSNIPPVTLNGISPGQLATTTGKQETITVSANSGGGNALLYRYYIYNYQTRLWAMVQGDSANPTLKWIFNEPGNYQIMCFIKDIESTNSYDAVAYCETTVSAAEVKVNGITPAELTTTPGKRETITVSASGGTELLYQYHIYNYQTRIWTMVRDYSTNPSLVWTFSNPGSYQVMCFVKDRNSGNWYDKAAYCETAVK
jgi:plastocyanin